MQISRCFVLSVIACTCAIADEQDTLISRGHELSTRDIQQGRNSSLYDQGGYFDFTTDFRKVHAQQPSKMARLRSFIWAHWAEKRRGYVRYSANSMDAGGTEHIFIEPSGSGAWRIVRRFVGWSAYPGPSSTPVSDRPDVVAVSRAQLRKSDEKGGNYALVFTYIAGETERF